MAFVGDILMVMLSVGCWAIIVNQLQDKPEFMLSQPDNRRWSNRLWWLVIGVGLVALMFFIAYLGLNEPGLEWRRNGVAAVHGWAIGTLSASVGLWFLMLTVQRIRSG